MKKPAFKNVKKVFSRKNRPHEVQSKELKSPDEAFSPKRSDMRADSNSLVVNSVEDDVMNGGHALGSTSVGRLGERDQVDLLVQVGEEASTGTDEERLRPAVMIGGKPTKSSSTEHELAKTQHEPARALLDVKQSKGSSTEQALHIGQSKSTGALLPKGRSKNMCSTTKSVKKIKCNVPGFDPDGPAIDKAYENVPTLEMIDLPRGGVSVETQAVGYVQFGIPPETIKDSMRLGIAVPSVYIVPLDRFCRDMGHALGVNLAEFEFPAYFNFFVQQKRCTLVVDSVDAERNIRRVFSETLLGPAQFRRDIDPLSHEEEDFAEDFPLEARPDFQKELKHFRIMPNGKELVLETLLKFCHFETASDSCSHNDLGVPPMPSEPLPPLADSGNHNKSASSENNEEETNCQNASGKAPKKISYSQVKWIGDVAKIYPSNATDEEIANHSTRRVEIFKMSSGMDYVVHDIDANNIIVGKARIPGHVRVTEGISVIGLADEDQSGNLDAEKLHPEILPSTFNPPSFGVTVLGNSHGFDKSGSTSGYVLWINGRGVMIDPPPYSSATLEREGIRSRTIVGIILTHCHADHDAGAFQKVLTGSPVVVITTPTIYKSFIRKYVALSSLSPALLKHSHRYKPAIIGEPLRFQGATFHFTYTLHTIPCVGFRVDWRGRSMVFTGDHFNNPPAIEKLQEQGVLSKARVADLSNLPLQETDLLLHEAGAPPIHTPLDVLMKLPEEVKKRLYVVHTSALPEGCDLRVAPTGTAGTIRLDQINRGRGDDNGKMQKRPSIFESHESPDASTLQSIKDGLPLKNVDEYAESELFVPNAHVYAHLTGVNGLPRPKLSEPPPVSLRPSSSSDAWFTLNLLSAVPFLSSLSYASTMEVLETARIDAFCCNDIVVPASRRKNLLVVIWEGNCVERLSCGRAKPKRGLKLDRAYNSTLQLSHGAHDDLSTAEVKRERLGAMWYAGDWTGPRALQPEKKLSGDSSTSETHDIVAMSPEGVKVITVDFTNLETILKNGSSLYRKYLSNISQENCQAILSGEQGKMNPVFENAVKTLNTLELLNSNTLFRKLTAVQKRHLECLVEGPVVYDSGHRLWRMGCVVEKAYIVVAGTVSFVPKRRNAVSVGNVKVNKKKTRTKDAQETIPATELEKNGELINENNLGESMRLDAMKVVREINARRSSGIKDDDENSGSLHYESDSSNSKRVTRSEENNSVTQTEDFVRLSRGLQKWAERQDATIPVKQRRGSSSTDASPEVSLHDFCESTTVHDESVGVGRNIDAERKKDVSKMNLKSNNNTHDTLNLGLKQPSKDRFANKVLGRLYNRRAVASGLVFSRGHFLGDIEKMVAGLLSSTEDAANKHVFGDPEEDALSLDTMTIHECESAQHMVHSSTLAAGKDGCIVLVLPKSELIPFLDEHPGLLLSLLGTQVIV